MDKTFDPNELKAQLHKIMETMADRAQMPRHPRGFQGPVVPDEMILVARFRDPATGRMYIADPLELEPGQGETPQADVFLRDYATVGARSPAGTSLVDVITKLAPLVAPGIGGGAAGWLGLIRGLFKKNPEPPR